MHPELKRLASNVSQWPVGYKWVRSDSSVQIMTMSRNDYAPDDVHHWFGHDEWYQARRALDFPLPSGRIEMRDAALAQNVELEQRINQFVDLQNTRDDLERQNAELVAQVALLNDAAWYVLDAWSKASDSLGASIHMLKTAINTTPAQHLRQIQADAVLEFAKQYKNKYEMLPATASPTVVSFANEYAERVNAGE